MADDIVNQLRKLACPECGLPSTHNHFDEAAIEIERLRKQRNELAWAIAWFLNGGSRDKLEQRFKDYEATL